MQLNSPLILFEADYTNYLKGEVRGVIRISVTNTWEKEREGESNARQALFFIHLMLERISYCNIS